MTTMAAENAGPAEPVGLAGGVLDRYRQVYAFVARRAEADAALDPFVRGAVDGGGRLAFLVDTAAPGDILHEDPFFVPPQEFLCERAAEGSR